MKPSVKNLFPNKALLIVSLAISVLVTFEPTKEGPLNDTMRGATAIVSEVNPSLDILTPRDGEEFEGAFLVAINDFDYRPDLATIPSTEFANGFQEVNRGHVHGWVFDEFGNQIRFYGAANTVFEDGVYIKPDSFAPGLYKAYFQLQYHDHTPVVQATAPAFPAIVSTVFEVTKGEDAGSNLPNCGCGKDICETFNR
jgi:hypothetical protein